MSLRFSADSDVMWFVSAWDAWRRVCLTAGSAVVVLIPIHSFRVLRTLCPSRPLSTRTVSSAMTLVVPSQILSTFVSRYRRAMLSSGVSFSRYPTPPRDSMHSARPAMDERAVVAFARGVMRRSKRSKLKLSGRELNAAAVSRGAVLVLVVDGLSVTPSSATAKKVRCIMARYSTC